MTTREYLEEIAYNNNVEIIEKYIKENDLSGLYCDNTILLNVDIPEQKKNEILSHELGHHFTLPDNKIFSDNYFHEYIADAWSYKTLLPLPKLINYKLKGYTVDEICEVENISEDFLSRTITYYKEILLAIDVWLQRHADAIAKFTGISCVVL